MVSVILPTYNERENIGKLIDSILHILKPPLEIIVVDDDSPDKTWEVVEEVSGLNKNIKLIRRLEKKGLVSAVREGINFAIGKIIILMDADFSMPPDILMQMVDCLDNFDIVVGSRYVGDGRDLRDSTFRVFSSRIFNLFAQWLLNSQIKDLTSCFLAFKRPAIDVSCIKGHYGEYCIGLLYQAQKDGRKIREFPYMCLPRAEGETKTSPNIFRFMQLGILYLSFLLKLRFKNS